MKYGVDRFTGVETRSFGSFVADSAANALFSGVWGKYVGKYVDVAEQYLKGAGGKLILIG